MKFKAELLSAVHKIDTEDVKNYRPIVIDSALDEVFDESSILDDMDVQMKSITIQQ